MEFSQPNFPVVNNPGKRHLGLIVSMVVVLVVAVILLILLNGKASLPESSPAISSETSLTEEQQTIMTQNLSQKVEPLTSSQKNNMAKNLGAVQ